MFFGAIIGGKVEPDNIVKIKREYCLTDYGKILFDLIVKCLETATYIDYITALTEVGKLKGTGEAKTYLSRIIGAVPDEYSPSMAAQALEEIYIRRTANDLINTIKEKLMENPEFAPELFRTAADKIEHLIEVKTDFDLKAELDHTAEELCSGKVSSLIIPTGISTIDKEMGGFSTQEISVIGARPGHGKTTTAVSLILSILRRNPELKAVLFELEMSKEQIKRKFISSVGKVSAFKMRIGDINEDDKKGIEHALTRIKLLEGRLFIYDNVYDLPTMHKIIRTTGARLSLIDYVGLMDEAQGSDIRVGINRMALQAKRFAKANNMCHLFYSQLNRGPEVREGHRPMTADLAESDGLSQAASEVVLLYYQFKYSSDPKHQKQLYFLVDKARHSAPFEPKLYFDPDLVILRDL